MLDRTSSESSHNDRGSLKQVTRFPNLRAAGALLCETLGERDLSNAVILGLALGGVPVAHEVALRLQLPFDLILIKRLLMRDAQSQPLCAVNVGGTTVLDERVEVPASPATPIEHFLADALKQLQDRERVCRAGRAPIEVADRTVVLVDCAIHTGSTMQIAVPAVRKLKPARIVSAVPITSRDGHALIEMIVDDFVSVAEADPFGHAGMWYEDFKRPNDDELYHLFPAV